MDQYRNYTSVNFISSLHLRSWVSIIADIQRPNAAAAKNFPGGGEPNALLREALKQAAAKKNKGSMNASGGWTDVKM